MIASIARTVALVACLLPISCFTTVLWEDAAPRDVPVGVSAASVTSDGNLLFEVERRGGGRERYSVSLEEHESFVPIHAIHDPIPAPTRAVILAPYDLKLVECSIDADHGPVLEFEQRLRDADAIGIWIAHDHMWRSCTTEVWYADSRREREEWTWHRADLPKCKVRWSHPGTWGAVVATPVTVVLDVLFLPFQPLMLLEISGI
jgi:hypothetical protein